MRTIRIVTLTLIVASAAWPLRAAIEPVDVAKRGEDVKAFRWGQFTCWSFSTFSGKELEEPPRPAQPADDSAAPVQTGPGHRFACADYSQDKVFIVAADGHVEWEHAAPGCDDVTVLPNGHVLFTTRTGVREVTPAKEIVFQYQSDSEIYACQRLPNGLTFIGECNAGRLLEVDPAGKPVHDIHLLPAGTQSDHVYMRNARRLTNGNYLVAHYGLDLVREYDPQGHVVREIPARGGPHSVVRLTNGNTLIACGDRPGGPRALEVDPAGKTVWELTQADLPDVHLAFLGGLHRLPNGNTVLSNWLGHDQFGKGPHVLEVTPDKKVVWTFADHRTMRAVASVQILDGPAQSELLH
jgi:hypothetical protein